MSSLFFPFYISAVDYFQTMSIKKNPDFNFIKKMICKQAHDRPVVLDLFIKSPWSSGWTFMFWVCFRRHICFCSQIKGLWPSNFISRIWTQVWENFGSDICFTLKQGQGHSIQHMNFCVIAVTFEQLGGSIMRLVCQICITLRVCHV